MINIRPGTLGIRNPFHYPRRAGRGPFAQALSILALGTLLLFPGARICHADPPAIAIYLFTGSGTVDVSLTYTYFEHHVYDPDGFDIGTVGVDNQIVNSDAQVVGYVGNQSP